jgi:C4-type Zn-finger protein
MIGEKSENNNIGSDEGTTDNSMSNGRHYCPICNSPMRTAGQLQMKNPLTGRYKMVQVYICSRCRYRSLG